MTEPTDRAISLEIAVAASLDAIWQALSDAEQLRRWFPLEARGTPGPDGEYTVGWGDGGEWTMRVAAWDPPRRLRLVSGAPGEDGAAQEQVLEWLVAGRDGAAVVRLVQSGFGPGAEWDEQIEGLTAGWGYFLYNLKHYLERHFGTPRDMVWARGRLRGARADPIAVALGSDGVASAPGWPSLELGEACSVLLGGIQAEGIVEVLRRPRTVGIRIPALGESLLFVEREGPGGLGLWLSTYGLPPERVGELRREMERRAKTLFEDA